MFGYYYKAGKSWKDKKLWEATKDNPQEDKELLLKDICARVPYHPKGHVVNS